MFFEERCIYSNKPVQKLLQYSAEELVGIDSGEILLTDSPSEGKRKTSGTAVSNYLCEGQYEVTLHSKKGGHIPAQLFVSKIDLGGKEAIVVNVKDISGEKRAEKELDESQEKYRLLTNRLDIGVFRLKAERHLGLIEANPAALQIFNIDNASGLSGLSVINAISASN